jgi:hypothetical protein
MTKKTAKTLKPGTKLFWSDPDDGACSRILIIDVVEVRGDMVKITDKDGGYLECPPSELSYC